MPLRSLRRSTLIVLLAVFAPAEDAHACGEAVFEAGVRVASVRPDHRPAAVASAEKALHEGRYGAAASGVRGAYPNLRRSAPSSGDALGARALRILAVATVRADGALYLLRPWNGSPEAHRRLNLEWAVASLRRLHDARKDDPGIQTELAEALSRVDGYRDEARALLTELATKDLIVSAHGYAALALLQSRAGDAKAYEEAVKRCEAISNLPGVCPHRVDS